VRCLLLVAVGSLAVLALAVWAIWGLRGVGESDQYIITLDADARAEPATGRVILFFIDEAEDQQPHRPPAGGPWWDPPQPIASIAVADLAPGASVVIDGSAVGFPGPLNDLDGVMRVQAVLDADDTRRSFLNGPGNVLSETVAVELAADRADRVELRLSKAVQTEPAPPDRPNLRWVELESPRLSAFYGRPVMHRCAVALPAGYDDPESSRTSWPTIYVIPSGDLEPWEAIEHAEMLRGRGVEEIAPIGVYVILDPEAPLGHHGFVDSPNNGPRATALVEELIPHIQEQFRVIRSPEARVLSGRAAGAWAALWLQMNHPDTFGACWASAPDPIDFSALLTADIYGDESIFVDEDRRERAAYRQLISAEGDMAIALTIRQIARIERAIDPDGRSGMTLDGWAARYSPRNDETGAPMTLFDSTNGRIDADVAGAWSRCDLTRLVTSDWDRYGPIVMERIHLNCGELDSFFLNVAVQRFKEAVESRAAAEGGWRGDGYVRIIPDTTHDELMARIFQRLNAEMRTYLRGRGLQD
jgi:hypothetical protein